MLLEVETKIKLEDSQVDEYRKRIKKIGKFSKKGKKVDDYFAIQRWGYPKKAFRTRTTKDRIEFNFKKHLEKFWTKDVVVKQEFEFVIDKEDYNDLIELFKDLGFKEWVRKEKLNEKIKNFIELISEFDIIEVARTGRVAISREPGVTEDYSDL